MTDNTTPDDTKTSAQDPRSKLEVLNRRKEDAFSRKQEISSQITEKLKTIGEYKKHRNDLTRQVRELKVERDKLNTAITAKIAEIKASRPAKVEPKPLPTGPKGERLHPQEIVRRMKILEQKIETVPMSFDAEQKVMKEIKQLKKHLDAINAIHGVNAESVARSREIDKLKHEANALHANVTLLAKQSQEFHEKLLVLSKEIEELKVQEEAAYQEFLAAKQEYVALTGNMKEAQAEQRAQRMQERKEHDKVKRAKEAEDQKTLMQRAKEAEEKMLKGEKLTTEDLLALQSLKE